MSYPDYTILHGLFESYLNIRTATWSMDSKNPAHSKLDPVAEEKRAICTEALLLFRDARSIQDWIQVSYELFDMEQCQYKKSDKTWIGWASKKFGYERIPFLADTLCAARAYINSQIANEPDFLRKKQSLAAKSKSSSASIIEKTRNIHIEGDISETRKTVLIDKTKLAENKLNALTDDPNYQKSYFTKIIKVNDVRSAELNEQSFDDFMANIKNNSRKNEMTLALIKDIPSRNPSKTPPLFSIKLPEAPQKTSPVISSVPSISPASNGASKVNNTSPPVKSSPPSNPKLSSATSSSNSGTSKRSNELLTPRNVPTKSSASSKNANHHSKTSSSKKDDWFVDLEMNDDDDNTRKYHSYSKV